MLRQPSSSGAGALAGVVMSIESDEDESSTAIALRNLSVEFGQTDHGGDSAGIVSSSVEPAVAVRDHIDSLVRCAGKSAPHERCLQVRNTLDIQTNFESRRFGR